MSKVEGPDFPDMEQLWQEYVREAPQREAAHRPWIEAQVCQAIRRARRGHDHMTAVNLWVRVPQCMGCAYSEARWMEESLRPAHIWGSYLADDYASFGFSRRQIQLIKRAIENGSWRPRCFWCSSTIDVAGEGFRVGRVDILEYFPIGTHNGKKPPQWMKEAVLRGFGGRCASCKKRLTLAQVTFDHVVPTAKGGRTEITNLQVLCQPCNGAKADHDVEAVDVELTFPLRPAPSDGYEGVIW